MNFVGRPTNGSDLDSLSTLRTSERALFRLRFAAALSRRIRPIGPMRAIGEVEKVAVWNGWPRARQGRGENIVNDPNTELRDLTVDITGS